MRTPMKNSDNSAKSALELQQWWRRRRATGDLTRQILAAFRLNGAKRSQTAKMTKEDLLEFLRQPDVCETMSKMFGRLFYRCYGLRGTGKIAEPNLNVRAMLSAFVVHHFPDTVRGLPRTSVHTEVENQANRFLDAFEQASGRLVEARGSIASVGRGHADEYLQAFEHYIVAFKTWKIHDETILLRQMGKTLREAYEQLARLRTGTVAVQAGVSRPRLERHLEERLQIVRYKYQQVGGEAALRAFDEVRGAEFEPAASEPPAHVTKTELTNTELAHELLLDPAFRMPVSGPVFKDDSELDRLEEFCVGMYFDSLTEDMCLEPPTYDRLLRVLGNLRSSVVELGTAGAVGGTGAVVAPASVHEMEQAIPVEEVRAVLEAGTLTWEQGVAIADRIFASLSGIRQTRGETEFLEEYAELSRRMTVETEGGVPCISRARASLLCAALRLFLDLITRLRRVLANGRLLLIAPTITAYGVEYERGKQQGELAKCPALPRTREWLGRCLGGATATPELHRGAVLALVVAAHPVTEETCPETLALDLRRLRAWHRDFHAATMAMTTLLRVADMARIPEVAPFVPAATQAISDFFVRGFFQVDRPFVWDGPAAAEGLAEAIAKLDAPGGVRVSITLGARQFGSPEDRVSPICFRRLAAAWSAATFDDLHPLMRPFASELQAAADVFARAVDVNLQVHHERYAAIVSGV